MPDKIKESTPHTSDESSSQPAMHAAIGRFESSTDADKAVKALKQAGFTDEAISVRDLVTDKQEYEWQQVESPASTIVGVEAEGEKAAEAWSILRDVNRTIVGKKTNG